MTLQEWKVPEHSKTVSSHATKSTILPVCREFFISKVENHILAKHPWNIAWNWLHTTPGCRPQQKIKNYHHTNKVLSKHLVWLEINNKTHHHHHMRNDYISVVSSESFLHFFSLHNWALQVQSNGEYERQNTRACPEALKETAYEMCR